VVNKARIYLGGQHPGKGSTFQIYCETWTRAVSVANRGPIQGEAAGIRNDFLVEDAEPLRKLAQAFLESNGFRVLSAQSEKLLSKRGAFSGHFDLLLTDVVSCMNGRVLASNCRCGSRVKVLHVGYTDSFIAATDSPKGTHLLQTVHEEFS